MRPFISHHPYNDARHHEAHESVRKAMVRPLGPSPLVKSRHTNRVLCGTWPWYKCLLFPWYKHSLLARVKQTAIECVCKYRRYPKLFSEMFVILFCWLFHHAQNTTGDRSSIPHITGTYLQLNHHWFISFTIYRTGDNPSLTFVPISNITWVQPCPTSRPTPSIHVNTFRSRSAKHPFHSSTHTGYHGDNTGLQLAWRPPRTGPHPPAGTCRHVVSPAGREQGRQQTDRQTSGTACRAPVPGLTRLNVKLFTGLYAIRRTQGRRILWAVESGVGREREIRGIGRDRVTLACSFVLQKAYSYRTVATLLVRERRFYIERVLLKADHHFTTTLIYHSGFSTKHI